ncbi:hypothetical protein EST38_g11682 [Candolleomyces aberdarensis]|uniref:Uncharacterized protein n=1 Tax=Candolleomyces aberdarensis TaxID=2316362 RepID=A0A4Q2D5S4_9AGAR|nr:hypothetical protein EST38_g11682 [Candolleomyces aberdarensis]
MDRLADNGWSSRTVINTEDAPGGLLIVRPTAATSAEPEQSSFSQPLPSTSNPPSKKFRASSSQPASQPLPSRSHSQQSFTNGLSRKPSSSSRLLDDDMAGEGSDADLERDVRAMEDEVDRLRRNSRAYTTIEGSLLSSSHPSESSSSNPNNAMFNFPPPNKPPSKSSGSSKAQGRGRPARSRSANNDTMDVDSTDSQIPIASNETPQQQRNKLLREGAMAAIKSSQDSGGDDGDERGRGRDASSGRGGKHRRASSLSRGKRISTAFETTGVITQPHNTVSESSFYKHIDADLPEVERVRQLLIWCSLRAASAVNKGAASPDGYTAPARPPPPTSSTAPAPTKLPPLSAKALEVLKKAQDEFVRNLAEKKVDLNIHATDGERSRASTEELKENQQNVRNRGCEVTYSGHIQRAQAEDEAWKRVSYEYDGYCKKLSASLEKRKKALEELKSSPLSSSSSKSKGKGKGKSRASTGGEGDVDMADEGREDEGEGKEGEDDEKHLTLYPAPHELPPAFQRGAQLARSILSRRPRPRLKPPSPSTPSPSKIVSHHARRRSSMRASLSRPSLPLDPSTSSSALPTTTDQDPLPDITEASSNLESILLGKLPTLPYILDTLHVHLNAARGTTSACERLLDERYRVLNRALEGRMRSSSVPPPASSAPGADDKTEGRGRGRSVLTTYLPSASSSSTLARSLYPSQMPSAGTGAGSSSRSQSVPPPPPPFPSTSHLPSPHTLLRALTRVDAARPPAQIGDAARRAAREVQRVEESGMGPIAGERRVTLLPGMASGTGVPATPRKGGGGGLAPPTTPGRRTPARDRTPGRERTPAR